MPYCGRAVRVDEDTGGDKEKPSPGFRRDKRDKEIGNSSLTDDWNGG